MSPRPLRVVLVVLAGCGPARTTVAPIPRAVPTLPDPPVQIKDAHDLAITTQPVAFTLGRDAIAIDAREIPIAPMPETASAIAKEIARLPAELRSLIHDVVVSPTPNPNDAVFTQRYGTTIVAAMSAGATGTVTIYPHGIEELSRADRDMFARNLMHELGHTWSTRDWAAHPDHRAGWIAAIQSDRRVPSRYAAISFAKSHEPYEDVAESTALFFAVRGTDLYDAYRSAMPARFAVLEARFPR